MKTSFLHQVEQNIQNNDLLSFGDNVLVAVSGGADSVCLLDVLYTLKEQYALTLHVAHLNHELRGEEAARDQLFVQSLCETYQLPFHTKNVDVKQLAIKLGVSTEEAGRNARYAFFEELKQIYHLNKIATAHNKNDNVETACMRFVRGTGIKGLCGIPAKNGDVIRPLLSVLREDIETYIRCQNLTFVTDSTNLTTEYTRNKVRLELIPYITSNLNPSFSDSLSEHLSIFSEAEQFLENCTQDYYQKMVHKHKLGVVISIADILKQDICIAKRIIRKAIEDVGHMQISQNMTSQIYAALTSEKHAVIQVSDYVSVHILYDNMYIIHEKDTMSFSAGFTDGVVKISELGLKFQITYGEKAPRHFEKNSLYIKADISTDKLLLRSRVNGDRMYLGNCGHKKIKDIFIDEKIPVFERELYPLLLYEGEIIWLCGVRSNPAYHAVFGKPYIQITYTKENHHA